MRPIVALVGRPNVGKSTLFNRLIGRARSIVHDEPGVTRDRIYADATLESGGREVPIVLVDTGGFDPKSADPVAQRVLDQTQLAIDEADLVVLVLDGRAGLLPEDAEIVQILRRGDKPAVLVANKLDGESHEPLAYEFARLGMGEILPLSAAHGRNVGELEDRVVAALPFFPDPSEAGETTDEAGPIRVAVIGRPNVGKSSLVNRILGEDRHIVSEVAGTTRDSVDSRVERAGKSYLFIDTAGIRRKRSIAQRVEEFSVVAALKGLDRSDVALLLLDVTETVAHQDARISAFSFEKGRAVILVASKWDARADEDKKNTVTDRIRAELPHLAYAPIVFTSARTGFGLDALFATIDRVHEEHGRRVSTGELNRFLAELNERHPPPTKKGRRAKIYYLTQIGVRPPRFLASVNDPELVHFSYRRFLVNELRRRYGFDGVPVLVGYRGKNKDKPRARTKRPKPRGGRR